MDSDQNRILVDSIKHLVGAFVTTSIDIISAFFYFTIATISVEP